MARLPRLAIAGYPHHVILRGNNRQAIFLEHRDRHSFLELLRQHTRTGALALHAYVLMDNHVHLLLTPQTAEGLSRAMQDIGRTYVRQFNQRHERTGTLWEGRYRSSVIQSERYLLACMVYIDLNPVRAGIVASAADFPWSSYGHLVGERADPLLTPHAEYWNLGNTPFARESAYAELVEAGLSPARQREMTEAGRGGWVLGDDGFASALQKSTTRRLTRGKAGRPRVRRDSDSGGGGGADAGKPVPI